MPFKWEKVHKMNVAAIQMKADFANWDKNLKIAKRLVSEAFAEGAEWVILPEFFPTAMGFHQKMVNATFPLTGKPLQLLKSLAAKHNGVVGGSFLARRRNECYNTFALVFPDGTAHFHDKDQPTMWENCYYIGGKDNGIFTIEAANIGIALCWEFIRTRTAKRLINKVDFVIGGSCWWTLPEKRVPGFPKKLHNRNIEIMRNTPAKLAKMLGVHVIHAAQAGDFECNMPLMPFFSYKSYYLGETQIVDGSGHILARMKPEEGEGFIMATIDPKRKWTPSEPIPNRFWIPNLPFQLRLIWWYQNQHGKWYYRSKTRPY
ncbi:MAG: Nitrilase/cyanide hydratase and apolipoprotein N-acyltransferase [Promethearchaeota archaeon]|nr:MAG: Nitrilase/cyanide hydratase and apolipoprotein N-acyltransferase [Candidatus Lokiarchaeota archaeon]